MVLLTWAVRVVAGVVLVLVLTAGFALALTGSFWVLAGALAVGSAVSLAAARARTRSAPRGPSRRHCLECGASVPAGAAVCPRCQSVEIAAAGGRRTGGGAHGRPLPVAAYSPDASGVIGWVDASPPGGDAEGGDASGGAMRVRSAALLLFAGLLASIEALHSTGSWLPTAAVFSTGVAGSALILRGPLARANPE